jgi:hypothetical protein
LDPVIGDAQREFEEEREEGDDSGVEKERRRRTLSDQRKFRESGLRGMRTKKDSATRARIAQKLRSHVERQHELGFVSTSESHAHRDIGKSMVGLHANTRPVQPWEKRPKAKEPKSAVKPGKLPVFHRKQLTAVVNNYLAHKGPKQLPKKPFMYDKSQLEAVIAALPSDQQPMARELILVLLQIGCVETNPGWGQKGLEQARRRRERKKADQEAAPLLTYKLGVKELPTLPKRDGPCPYLHKPVPITQQFIYGGKGWCRHCSEALNEQSMHDTSLDAYLAAGNGPDPTEEEKGKDKEKAATPSLESVATAPPSPPSTVTSTKVIETSKAPASPSNNPSPSGATSTSSSKSSPAKEGPGTKTSDKKSRPSSPGPKTPSSSGPKGPNVPEPTKSPPSSEKSSTSVPKTDDHDGDNDASSNPHYSTLRGLTLTNHQVRKMGEWKYGPTTVVYNEVGVERYTKDVDNRPLQDRPIPICKEHHEVVRVALDCFMPTKIPFINRQVNWALKYLTYCVILGLMLSVFIDFGVQGLVTKGLAASCPRLFLLIFKAAWNAYQGKWQVVVNLCLAMGLRLAVPLFKARFTKKLWFYYSPHIITMVTVETGMRPVDLKTLMLNLRPKMRRCPNLPTDQMSISIILEGCTDVIEYLCTNTNFRKCAPPLSQVNFTPLDIDPMRLDSHYPRAGWLLLLWQTVYSSEMKKVRCFYIAASHVIIFTMRMVRCLKSCAQVASTTMLSFLVLTCLSAIQWSRALWGSAPLPSVASRRASALAVVKSTLLAPLQALWTIGRQEELGLSTSAVYHTDIFLAMHPYLSIVAVLLLSCVGLLSVWGATYLNLIMICLSASVVLLIIGWPLTLRRPPSPAWT